MAPEGGLRFVLPRFGCLNALGGVFSLEICGSGVAMLRGGAKDRFKAMFAMGYMSNDATFRP